MRTVNGNHRMRKQRENLATQITTLQRLDSLLSIRNYTNHQQAKPPQGSESSLHVYTASLVT